MPPPGALQGRFHSLVKGRFGALDMQPMLCGSPLRTIGISHVGRGSQVLERDSVLHWDSVLVTVHVTMINNLTHQ